MEIDRKFPLTIKNFFTTNRVRFTLFSVNTTFFFIVGYYIIFELLWGGEKAWEYLYETYLYHFIRKDPRHNYSIFFYCTY